MGAHLCLPPRFTPGAKSPSNATGASNEQIENFKQLIRADGERSATEATKWELLQSLLKQIDDEIKKCREGINSPAPDGPPVQPSMMNDSRKALLRSMIQERRDAQVAELEKHKVLSDKVREALKAHINDGWATLERDLGVEAAKNLN